LKKYTYENFCKEEIELNDITFTPYTAWTFLPSISRTSFVKEIWKKGDVKKHHRPENLFQKTLYRDDVSYKLGSKYEVYVDHLGEGKFQTIEMIKKL
jgi:hypothetical protein